MSIDSVIAEMYDSVSFAPGERPDWSRQNEIFAPGARMVRVSDDGVFEFDLASFSKNLDAMIDSGVLPSFWEGEIWRETHLFGEVAHVLSAYETRWTREGDLINRGVNSIQLFQRDGRWWISAMIWRRDGKSVKIGEVVPNPT
jgi:aryl carrier-like protein